MKKEEVGFEDFEYLKLISKGAFGKVWIVKRKSTNDIYAMKLVNLAENVKILFLYLFQIKNLYKYFFFLKNPSIVEQKSD